MYVKKSAGGPPFLQYGPAYWDAKLGRQVACAGWYGGYPGFLMS
jgi:hypothetical protein